MKENFEDTILISSNAHTPVQERGGARGDKWLHDTFIRCGGGEVVGCHAVVLAASSPVLRKALVGATKDSEEPAVVFMMDFSSEEVDNLMTLLYSGTCRHTDDMTLLLHILRIDSMQLKSDRPLEKLIDDVKDEAKEVYEDYWELDQQISSMIEKEDAGWRCKICNKLEKYNSKNMVVHVEGNHIEGGAHPCTECGKVLRTRDSLRKHYSKVHGRSFSWRGKSSLYEEEDTYLHSENENGLNDNFDNEELGEYNNDMIDYKDDDQSSEDDWKPKQKPNKKKGKLNKEYEDETEAEKELNSKGNRSRKSIWNDDDEFDEWNGMCLFRKKKQDKRTRAKEQARTDEETGETGEGEWRPNEEQKKKRGRPKNMKEDEDGQEEAVKSDEEDENSDYIDSKPNTERKKFNYRKDKLIIDKTVNVEALINEINQNPDQTMTQMELNGVPIFHYACKHCDHTFQNIIKYSKHMHKAHKENIQLFNDKYRHYVCFGCSRRFLTINARTKHMQEEHKDALKQGMKEATNTKNECYTGKPKKAYSCPHCKEHIEGKEERRNKSGGVPAGCTKETLAEHILQHELGEEGLWCKQCPEKFGIINKLRKHIVKAHLTTDIVCPDCGKLLPSNKAYQAHLKKAHGPKELTPKPKPKEQIEGEGFFCGLCGKIFPKRNALMYHKRVTHDDVSTLYSCTVCGKKTYNKRNHERHASLHLPPTIPCDQCAKMFHNKIYLQRHISSQHTAYEDMPFKCDQCGKGFNLANQLEFHMNMHLNLKPFKCRYCNNCYQNPSNCMSHEKKSHPDLYKKLTKGLGGVRVKDRDQGIVRLTEEQLGISRMERTYLDDMGNRRVLNPDEEASRKELKLGPSYQYS